MKEFLLLIISMSLLLGGIISWSCLIVGSRYEKEIYKGINR